MRKIAILCLLLGLAAGPAYAAKMTGELVIDGISFQMDFELPEEIPAEVTGYTAQARVWGSEPKEQFDAALFLPNLEEAANEDCGFDGQRMYRIGEYDKDPFAPGESLRIDHQLLSVEYANNFGGKVFDDCARGFLYQPGQGTPAERFHAALPRYRNPAPGEVEDMEGLRYQDALTVLAPYLEAGGLDIGEPCYVEAWSRELARDYIAWGASQEPLPYERNLWAKAPAYYSIHLPVRIGGLECQRYPHISETYDKAHEICTPMDIHAIVSERGLEYLRMRPFLTDLRPIGTPQPMLDAGRVLELLANADDFWDGAETFYDGDVLERDLTILGMTPTFVIRYTLPMTGSYELAPAWEFQVLVEALEDWGDDQILRIERVQTFTLHAVTGERIG